MATDVAASETAVPARSPDTQGLPLLQGHRASLPKSARRIRLLLVTHVLPTSVPYIAQLAEDFEIVSVLAIPYSFDEAAARRLAGLPVVRCASTGEVAQRLAEEVTRCSSAAVPFVVQEIGGYFASELAARRHIDGLLGVVEDTRQGHWRYAAVADDLQVPVLSIAESPLKALEHHQIGRAIVYSVERQVRAHFYRSLAGESVAVLGFGDIGSAAAHALRGRNAFVSVYDTDPHKRASAWMQNFPIGRLDEVVRGAHIIIGCSGATSIDEAVLEAMPNGALVVSGSSRQVEIDLEHVRHHYRCTSQHGDLTEYVGYDKHFYLANNGMPINFLDGSAIGSTLDLVYTELYACTRLLAEGQLQTAGLQALEDTYRDQIVERWLELYAYPYSRSGFRPVVAVGGES